MDAIQELESEIIGRINNLNGAQKNDVLHYIERIPGRYHSTRRYRRRAMKQIRHALENQLFKA